MQQLKVKYQSLSLCTPNMMNREPLTLCKEA